MKALGGHLKEAIRVLKLTSHTGCALPDTESSQNCSVFVFLHRSHMLCILACSKLATTNDV